jgi:hypothetical protein
MQFAPHKIGPGDLAGNRHDCQSTDRRQRECHMPGARREQPPKSDVTNANSLLLSHTNIRRMLR